MFQLDLFTRVASIQNALADLARWLLDEAVLVRLARPEREDDASLDALLGRVGDDESSRRLPFGLVGEDDDSVVRDLVAEAALDLHRDALVVLVDRLVPALGRALELRARGVLVAAGLELGSGDRGLGGLVLFRGAHATPLVSWILPSSIPHSRLSRS